MLPVKPQSNGNIYKDFAQILVSISNTQREYPVHNVPKRINLIDLNFQDSKYVSPDESKKKSEHKFKSELRNTDFERIS